MAGVTSPPATFRLGVEALRFELQGVESVLRELKKFFPADAQVVRVHDDVSRDSARSLRRTSLRNGELPWSLMKQPLAGDGLDDALVFELGVGLGDGVAIDAEVLGERPDAGKGFARLHRAGGGGDLHLVDQLLVDGLAGLEVELKSHRVTVI